MNFPMPDLSGKTFGQVTIIKRVANDKHSKSQWECLCACGNKIIVGASDLKTGNTKSCGCLRRSLLSKKRKIHGRSYDPIYCVWVDMRQRCLKPTNKAFKNYGGRGIKICKRWDNFENFAADMGERPADSKYELDRINPNGNYEPANCRWIPAHTGLTRKSKALQS